MAENSFDLSNYMDMSFAPNPAKRSFSFDPWGASQDIGSVTGANVPVMATTPGGPDLWDRAFGWTDPTNQTKHMGFAGPAMSGLSSLVSGFMGMSALKEARAARAQQQKQFDMNYGAQQTLTNSMLEDRQRARVASNPGAYQSVGDYMTQNKVA